MKVNIQDNGKMIRKMDLERWSTAMIKILMFMRGSGSMV
jgi:hypothetical protein